MVWYSRAPAVTRVLSRSLNSSLPRSSAVVLSMRRRATPAHRHVHEKSKVSSRKVLSQDYEDDSDTKILPGFPSAHTIYALSSGQGKAGIAVVRISGPACVDIYRHLCPYKQLPKARQAAVRILYDPEHPDTSHILDPGALVLYFPAPKTVTGEDVLELHVHGGAATVKAVLGAIPRCDSSRGRGREIRYAEPGEFTRRAFFNGCLDLSQVESLSDVLDAETEQQRRAAVRGTLAARGQTYKAWREELVLARGEMEALIDFSEDQHFDESPFELLRNVAGLVRRILGSIDLHDMAGQRTELLRKGIRIALLGPPNVGKSSLMNLILGREASIVAREAGTTRDVVEASLDVGDYLCTFADTAGIRAHVLEGDGVIGPIEEEGIRRARLKALSSDVVIVLAAIESKAGVNEPFVHFDSETLQLATEAKQHLIVVNKCDSVEEPLLDRLLNDFKTSVLSQIKGLTEVQRISCKEAATPSRPLDKDPGGIHELVQNLKRSFEELTSLPEALQDLVGGTERQRQLLAQCRGHLEDFTRLAEASGPEAGASEDEPDIVLAAEHLRYAANCLAQITGRGEAGDVEEVLGVIFEKFCVGK